MANIEDYRERLDSPIGWTVTPPDGPSPEDKNDEKPEGDAPIPEGKKIIYAEPADYFPVELRKKYKLGEFAEEKDEK